MHALPGAHPGRQRFGRRLLIASALSLLGVLAAERGAEAQQAPAPAAPKPAAPIAPKPSPPAASAVEPSTRAEGMRLYQQALEKRRLAATAPLSTQRLREDLAAIESKLLLGRRDEAIGDLVYIVESPRFAPFAQTDEGRAAVYLLGDALGRVGAYEPARAYLKRLLGGDPANTWYRRAARSLIDFGLDSARPDPFLKDLQALPASAPAELLADVAYLRGRAFERRGDRRRALVEYGRVTPRSRFWAQANYLSGLIEVERGRLEKGENLLCKIADPKLTPRDAPLFGGTDFFRIRDLARLGLGRIAHEEFRFDDAHYYYYLVPRDSGHLPEALYEASTTRYEAKDYDAAREYMDELRSLAVNHPYEDEAWILDAYIDLATCEFPRANAKLELFLTRYEPVRDAARRLTADDRAVHKLADAVRLGSDPAAAGLGVGAGTARTLAALLRVDADYTVASRRLAQLDHQLSGLRRAMSELDEARRKLASPAEVKPHAKGARAESDTEKLERIESQLSELRRLLREAQRRGKAGARLGDLEKQIVTLELRARAARSVASAVDSAGGARGTDLVDVIAADRERATALYNRAQRVRQQVADQQVALAKDALVRLERRLSRLLARARLGRIETVLGRKRALELEIEALSQGLLPQSMVDSLDAERYLRDDEEYWPFEGEDWADEYVGGEGLR